MLETAQMVWTRVGLFLKFDWKLHKLHKMQYEHMVRNLASEEYSHVMRAKSTFVG